MANQGSAVPPPAPVGPPQRIERPRKPQFSLRSMLIAMTAFAVVAAISTFVGVETIAVVLAGIAIMLMVPVAFGALAFYSGGRRQTFFAGAFVGSLLPHVLLRDQPSGLGQLLWLSMIMAVAIPACGFAALYARQFVERRGWNQPPRDE